MLRWSRGVVVFCTLLGISCLLSGPARAQNLFCSLTAIINGTNSTACGTLSVVNGNLSTASGYTSTITGNNAVAYGALSTAGTGASAIGQNSTASATDSIAFGHNAFTNQSLSIALGSNSSVTAANGIALGPSASVTAAGAIAIGSGSVADTANTVSVGAVGSERKIVNLASGTLSAASRDAVTGSQLFATNSNVTANTSAIVSNTTAIATANANFLTANQRVAATFGGGSTVDVNGIVTAPSYTVQGQTFSNVSSTFGALDTQVTAHTASIATNASNISNLSSQLASGAIGLLKQDVATRTISVAAATDGTVIDVTGSAGSRKLTGVLAGTVSAGSTDAVNGAQLSATNTQVTTNTTAIASQAAAMTSVNSNFATANQRVAAAFGGGSTVDGNGIVTSPSYTVQGQTFNNVGGAFGAIDNRVTTNTSDIASINTQLTNGSIGLLRQDGVTRTISVASLTDGTVIDVTGTAGTRKLTGVRAGTLSAASTDAVNGAQLTATNDQVTTNSTAITAHTTAIATANTNFATANQRVAAAFGGGSAVDANGIVTAPSYSVQGQIFTNVGGAFGALDTRVTTNTSDIATLGTQLTNGAVGLVRQDAGTRTLSVGATTDGTVMDLTGTAGTRRLTGVHAGTIGTSSTDAVNGAQLAATNSQVATNTSAIGANTSAITTANTNFTTANQRIAAAFGGGSTVDANGIVTAPSYSVQGQIYSNVGSAFGALDSRVTTNTSDIATLSTQLTNGAVGLVRQDAGTRTLSVGATTDGTVMDVTGTAGTRRLTGVHAGTIGASSTDAVNGAQLATTNSQVATNTSAISANTSAITTASTNFAAANQRIAAAFGGGSTVDANGIVTLPNYVVQGQAYGSVGGAIGALNAAAIGFRTDIDDISGRLNNGSMGLVRQDSGSQAITIASGSGGTSIDASGSAGARRLTGLLAGSISSNSSDAVTGSQFYTLDNQVSANAQAIAQNAAAISLGASHFVTANQRIASFFGGGAAVDVNGIVTAPSYTILGNSYGNVGNALAALNSRVETNSTNIANLMSGGGGSGGGGFVTQDPALRTINVATTSDGTVVNVAGTDGNRTISGVAAGNVAAGSSDAVNGSQLAATNAAVASTAAYASNTASGMAAALGGGAAVASDGTVTNPQYTIRNQTYGSVGGALGAVDAALADTNTNVNNLAQSVQNVTQSSRYVNVNSMSAPAMASGSEAIAFGSNAGASGAHAIAIGAGSAATQTGALAMGTAARATGVNAIAIGTNAVATGSVAVGVNASASNGGAALGDNSIATGTDSAALGPNATATAARSVAIGSGSVASEANVVSVGNSGATRRITNVSYGVAPTDAVNVAQLTDTTNQFQQQIDRLYGRADRMERDIQRNAGGVAMAMALSGNTLPQGKRFGVAMGVGAFGGQYAVGVSNFYRVTENIVLASGIAFQEGNIGGRAGVMAAW